MLEEITANGDGINLSLQGQIDEPLEAGAQRLPGLRPRLAARLPKTLSRCKSAKCRILSKGDLPSAPATPAVLVRAR